MGRRARSALGVLAVASGSVQRRSSLHDALDVLGLDAGGIHDVLAPECLAALLEVLALEAKRLQLVDGHTLAGSGAQLVTKAKG